MRAGITLTGGGFAVTPSAVAASTIDLIQGN